MAYKTLVGNIESDAAGNKADFYNNTIANTLLMPTTDSLVSDYDLEAFDTAGKINSDAKKSENVALRYKLCIPIPNDEVVEFSLVQSISGMGMSRENDPHLAPFQNQTTNLPGPASYDDISISLTYTKNSFFLTWLTNGVQEGWVQRADIEIHVLHTTQIPVASSTPESINPASGNEKIILMKVLLQQLVLQKVLLQ